MYGEVLKFWFEELEPKQWWVKDRELDQLINARFSEASRNASPARCTTSQE